MLPLMLNTSKNVTALHVKAITWTTIYLQRIILVAWEKYRPEPSAPTIIAKRTCWALRGCNCGWHKHTQIQMFLRWDIKCRENNHYYKEITLFCTRTDHCVFASPELTPYKPPSDSLGRRLVYSYSFKVDWRERGLKISTFTLTNTRLSNMCNDQLETIGNAPVK